MKRAHNSVDMTGNTYGNWKILEYQKTVHKAVYYKALCLKCNTVHSVQGKNIRRGLSTCCLACAGKTRGINQTGKMKKGKDAKLITYEKILKNYKKAARERSLAFNISPTTFMDMLNQNCHYCQTPPMTTVNGLKGSGYSQEKLDLGWVTYNGIDRVDSSKGYDLNNVVTCCKLCNRAKNDLTTEEFKVWIVRAVSNIHNW